MDNFEDTSSSLLQGANATAPLYEFLGTVPGFDWLQDFIPQWVKLDIRMIAAALTILGMLSGALQFLQSVTMKFYWYITRFLTASVSINARDKLNREVLNWVGAQVLTRQGARIVTARSEGLESDAYSYHRIRQPRIDYGADQRQPIQ